MNSYHDVTAFTSIVSAQTQQLLNSIFLGNTSQCSSSNSDAPVHVQQLSVTDKSALFAFLRSKGNSVLEELTTRVTLMNAPTLADVFTDQRDYQTNVQFIVRKLKLLRLLMPVLLNSTDDDQKGAHSDHMLLCSGETLLASVGELLDFLSKKFSSTFFNMGVVLGNEIAELHRQYQHRLTI